jgi:hypothetical protein
MASNERNPGTVLDIIRWNSIGNEVRASVIEEPLALLLKITGDCHGLVQILSELEPKPMALAALQRRGATTRDWHRAK